MKPIFKSKVSSHNKYTQLLITLIANFVLAPFLRGNIGELALSLISLYAIIISIIHTYVALSITKSAVLAYANWW